MTWLRIYLGAIFLSWGTSANAAILIEISSVSFLEALLAGVLVGAGASLLAAKGLERRNA